MRTSTERQTAFSLMTKLARYQNRAQVINIRAGRSRHEQIADRVECRPCIVVGETRRAILARLLQARTRRTIGNSARIVFRSIDAIRVGGKRMDIVIAIDIEGEGQQELAVASALAAFPTNGDSGFAA